MLEIGEFMKHIYYHTGADCPTFVVLHGTGGDEMSLLPALEHLKEKVNILSVRGNVNENGMLRFFERKAEGIYNLESLDTEMHHLKNFIVQSSSDYGFSLENVVLFGFSNGANIGIHLLLNEAKLFNYGIFMAPLYPLTVANNQDFSHKKVYFSMGRMDPICSMDKNQELLNVFETLGIEKTLDWVQGHELNYSVLQGYTNWYIKYFGNKA